MVSTGVRRLTDTVTSTHIPTADWSWTKQSFRILGTGDEGMKTPRCTDGQITFALRQAKGGTPVAEA